jgi:hypothetical protein
VPYRVPAEMPEGRASGGRWIGRALLIAAILAPVACCLLFEAMLGRSGRAVYEFCETTPPVGAVVDLVQLRARARELDIGFEDNVGEHGEHHVGGIGGYMTHETRCSITVFDGRVTRKQVDEID